MNEVYKTNPFFALPYNFVILLSFAFRGSFFGIFLEHLFDVVGCLGEGKGSSLLAEQNHAILFVFFELVKVALDLCSWSGVPLFSVLLLGLFVLIILVLFLVFLLSAISCLLLQFASVGDPPVLIGDS